MALLKTLGFTRRQLAATVAWQASVITVIGSIVGTPGVVIGRWLWTLLFVNLCRSRSDGPVAVDCVRCPRCARTHERHRFLSRAYRSPHEGRAGVASGVSSLSRGYPWMLGRCYRHPTRHVFEFASLSDRTDVIRYQSRVPRAVGVAHRRQGPTDLVRLRSFRSDLRSKAVSH